MKKCSRCLLSRWKCRACGSRYWGYWRETSELNTFVARTDLPRDADHVVLRGLERSGRAWGRFNVKIEGRSPLLIIVGWLMGLRETIRQGEVVA